MKLFFLRKQKFINSGTKVQNRLRWCSSGFFYFQVYDYDKVKFNNDDYTIKITLKKLDKLSCTTTKLNYIII